MQSLEDGLSSSILRASPSVDSISTQLHPDVVATARAALHAERTIANFKRVMLASHASSLLTRVETKSTKRNEIGDLQLAFSQGPITGDRLPLPRRPPPPPPLPAPIAQPSTVSMPTPTRQLPSLFAAATPASQATSAIPKDSSTPTNTASNPPPLTFKAPVSFSFATPPAASTPPAGATSSGGSRSRGSSRTHSSAVQLRGSPSATGGTAPNGVESQARAGTFDWGPLPTVAPTRPPGFVPFSSVSSSGHSSRIEAAANGAHSEGDELEGEEWNEDEFDDDGEEGLDSIQEGEEE